MMKVTKPASKNSERGFVTAEASVVLPALIGFTAALLACVMIGLHQVQLDAGAREIARDVARGDRQHAREIRAALPAQASVRVRYSEESVAVAVEERRQWVLPLLGPVGLTLSANAQAALEPDATTGQGAGA